MKRVLLLILGAILIVVGLFLGIVGGTLAAIVGPSGSVQTGVGTVSGDGYALVFNEFAINTIINVDAIDGMGDFSVQAESTTANQLFIGIGPTDEVNSYLTGSARDIVSDITSGSARVVPIPGGKVPADPVDQTFWIAQDQGARPTVPLAASGPNTTLVIMNVVPAKPVGAEVQLGMTSSTLFPVGLGVLIVGVLLFVLGVFAVVKGVRGKRPPAPPMMAGQSSVAEYAVGGPASGQASQPVSQQPPTQST